MTTFAYRRAMLSGRAAFRPALAAAILLLTAIPAMAQIIVDPSARNPEQSGRPARQANLSPLASAPWPRLDPGALFCKTRDALNQHTRAIDARLNGTPLANPGTVDCRIIPGQAAIDIVARSGPGATEVRLKANNETGWTDAYLPTQAPR